jgi:hypothetical protein
MYGRGLALFVGILLLSDVAGCSAGAASDPEALAKGCSEHGIFANIKGAGLSPGVIYFCHEETWTKPLFDYVRDGQDCNKSGGCSFSKGNAVCWRWDPGENTTCTVLYLAH